MMSRFVIALLLFITSVAAVQAQPLQLRVLRKDGKSLVRKPGEPIRPLFTRDMLPGGSLFRTGAKAEFDFGVRGRGAFSRAEGGTIGRVHRARDNRVDIDLQDGLFLTAIGNKPGTLDYRVATPQLVTGGKDVVFSLKTSSAERMTRITVTHGQLVIALGSGKRILLREGFFIEAQGEGRETRMTRKDFISSSPTASDDAQQALVFFSGIYSRQSL